MTEPLPVSSGGRFEQVKRILAAADVRNLTAVNLQTREHNFGVISVPARRTARIRIFEPAPDGRPRAADRPDARELRRQHDAQRRTKEYELLTEIGKAISSRLDQDEILRTIRSELGQIFDTSDFYIAFQEGGRDPL